MNKELKKLCVCFFICIFFCLSCKTEVTKYIQLEPEHTSIVWKGSFASADEIDNPQYLWAYYNTTDGCSYIYDGEKWTLLTSAGKNGADGLDGQNGTDGTNGTDGSNGTNGKNARVVILYALNGGKLPEGAPSIYSYGTPVELEEPVFEPYNFEGFYYNADFSGKKVTSLDDDYAYGKVLYARWGYRITFDDNYTGGELNTLEYYDIDSVNNSFKTPVRTGHTFLGWYNNPNYDEQIDCWNTNENKGNVTLYAKWKINEYTITYKDDYGLSPEPVKVEYNTILDKTYFPDLSNDDYRFIEWKEGESSVGPGYVVTDDVVFTAVIEPLYFTVNFYDLTGILDTSFEDWDENSRNIQALYGTSGSKLTEKIFQLAAQIDLESMGINLVVVVRNKQILADDYTITENCDFDIIAVPMYMTFVFCDEVMNGDAVNGFILIPSMYQGLNGRFYGSYEGSFFSETIKYRQVNVENIEYQFELPSSFMEEGMHKIYAIYQIYGYKFLISRSWQKPLLVQSPETYKNVSHDYYYEVTICH